MDIQACLFTLRLVGCWWQSASEVSDGRQRARLLSKWRETIASTKTRSHLVNSFSCFTSFTTRMENHGPRQKLGGCQSNPGRCPGLASDGAFSAGKCLRSYSAWPVQPARCSRLRPARHDLRRQISSPFLNCLGVFDNNVLRGITSVPAILEISRF